MNELARRSHTAVPKTGVLLVNLGTPDAPTPSAIRRYLAQFLADRRVVEIPRAIWLPLLYLFILPLRPRRLAHAYSSVWTEQGSPLLAISKRQAVAVRMRLAQQYGAAVPVALAMTYGEPSIPAAIAELEAEDVRRIVLLPLYPQYSGSTTAATYDAVFKVLQQRRWVPELRTIGSYHDHPAYIAALATSVRNHWQQWGRGDHLLMSFHGVPQRYVLNGDPYYCQCLKTGRLLAEALQLQTADYTVSFQSRFGKAPWVQPYTQATVEKLAKGGVKTLDVVCPGFAADCLETLEEVSLGYADNFHAAGGTAFRYIPALNSETGHIDALVTILAPQLRQDDAITPSARDAEQRAQAAEPAFYGRE